MGVSSVFIMPASSAAVTYRAGRSALRINILCWLLSRGAFSNSGYLKRATNDRGGRAPRAAEAAARRPLAGPPLPLCPPPPRRLARGAPRSGRGDQPARPAPLDRGVPRHRQDDLHRGNRAPEGGFPRVPQPRHHRPQLPARLRPPRRHRQRDRRKPVFRRERGPFRQDARRDQAGRETRAVVGHLHPGPRPRPGDHRIEVPAMAARCFHHRRHRRPGGNPHRRRARADLALAEADVPALPRRSAPVMGPFPRHPPRQELTPRAAGKRWDADRQVPDREHRRGRRACRDMAGEVRPQEDRRAHARLPRRHEPLRAGIYVRGNEFDRPPLQPGDVPLRAAGQNLGGRLRLCRSAPCQREAGRLPRLGGVVLGPAPPRRLGERLGVHRPRRNRGPHLRHRRAL